MIHLPEIWQHVATGAQFIILRNEVGVQAAAGPLTFEEIHEIQYDESLIPWKRGLADIIQQHAAEYITVWPQGESEQTL